MSRLLTAVNPESGTISYVYDSNGNLTSKTDARSITTTYTYDALNRVTARDYSDSTPDVTYTYDNKTHAYGKLTKVTNGTGADRSTTEYTAFDFLGRVTAHKQTTDSVDYTTGYTYNLSGALIEETYPSGRVVKNTLDSADGSLSQVQSKRSGDTYRNYANGFIYNAVGAVTAMKLGNNRWENTTFNSRLQPTQIGLGSGVSSQSLLKLEYSYGTTANNGNVTKQTITVPGVANPFVQTYTYDELNRLSVAEETQNSSQTWKQSFSYDRYGNRNFDEGPTTTLPKLCNGNTAVCPEDVAAVNPSVNTSNNRLNGYSFDSAGNTATDADNRTFIYDAENKQVEVRDASNQTIGQYVYNGDGLRIKKVVPGGETTVFVYDAAGKQIAEYSTVVQTGTNAKTVYTTNDNLGSPRINTDGIGNVISRHDYHPFGEEVARSGYGSDTIRKQFTGYEHDSETEQNYAMNRYQSPSLGRFSTPDPYQASARSTNPQTWNRYVYAQNNPVKFIDPDGLDVQLLDKKSIDRVLSTLPDELRDKVRKQIDKDGYLKKGSLDKIKSNDENFADLKSIVDGKGVVEVMTSSKNSKGGDFDFVTANERRKEDKEALRKAGATENEISMVDSEDYVDTVDDGETLSADESPSGRIRVIVADGTGKTSDESEVRFAMTTAHELYVHAMPAQQGRPFRHDNGGPVDKRKVLVEERTQKLYKPTNQTVRPQK